MNSYLIDANQLVYSLNPASPQRTAVVEAFRMLVLGSHPTYLVPQSLTEFWVVATKPVNLAQPQHSGLGLTTAEARAEVDVFRATFDLLPDALQCLRNGFASYSFTIRRAKKRMTRASSPSCGPTELTAS